MRSVCDAAVSLERDSEQNQRKIHRKNEKDIYFLEVYGKIVRGVKLFQKLGDFIVQADPGYAALPWLQHILRCIRKDQDLGYRS